LVGDYWDLLLDVLPHESDTPPGLAVCLAGRRLEASVSGRRHRADTDVRYLVELYRIALGSRQRPG
jgi:hypothetical protein